MSIPPNREDLNRITSAVIQCAYRVSNTLGCGFLEKVYENTLINFAHPRVEIKRLVNGRIT